MPSTMSKFIKGGNAGIKGITFQIHLIMFCLLKAMDKLKDWRLSSENQTAGKFDDVVVEHPEGSSLIQTKYRQSGKISFEELISTNSKHDDFSLVKYFLSYMKIKSEFKVTNVIICTNATVTLKKEEKELLKSQEATSDSILHCPGRNCSFYKFDKKMVYLLRTRLKDHFEARKEKDDNGENAFTDEDIEDFLQHLQFYYNFPCEADLKRVMEDCLTNLSLSRRIFNKITLQDVLIKISDWFEQPKGPCEYLTEEGTQAMFSEIHSNRYCEKLNWCNVLFKRNDLNFEGIKRIFHVIMENEYLLKVLKIFRTLHDKKKKLLFIKPEDEVATQRQTLEAFDRPCYEFLIIVWPKIPHRDVLVEICTKLKETLERYTYKKVILVAKNDDTLNRHLDSDENVHKMDVPVDFSHLSKESQERVFNEKKIVYQTKKFTVAEIYGRETCHCPSIAVNILEKIVKGDEIIVMPYVHVENCDNEKKKGSESADEQNRDSRELGSSVSMRFLAERMVYREKRNMIEFTVERDVNIEQECQGRMEKNADLDIVRMLLDCGMLVSIGNESGTKTYCNYLTSR